MPRQKFENIKTVVGSTLTADGPIPHFPLMENLNLPVRLCPNSGRELWYPERDEKGRPVYALPGGGKYVPY